MRPLDTVSTDRLREARARLIRAPGGFRFLSSIDAARDVLTQAVLRLHDEARKARTDGDETGARDCELYARHVVADPTRRIPGND